jgi:short-subunit dehydrogenase
MNQKIQTAKMDWKKEVILITGASSGLGKELALQGAELGACVILVARNIDRLTSIATDIESRGGIVFFKSFDLADCHNILKFYKKLINDTHRNPTILINNAGYNVAGFVQNTPLELYEHNYRINTLAPIALTQAVLPEMLQQNKGYIVNIMSAAMYHSFPGISSYCSSKFAMGAIHESLEAELSQFSVNTLYVNPGGFKSRYWQNMDKGNRLGKYAHPVRKNDPQPREVAIAIFNAIEKKKTKINLSGWMDKVGEGLNFFIPDLFKRILAKRNQALLDNYPLDTKKNGQ